MHLQRFQFDPLYEAKKQILAIKWFGPKSQQSRPAIPTFEKKKTYHSIRSNEWKWRSRRMVSGARNVDDENVGDKNVSPECPLVPYDSLGGLRDATLKHVMYLKWMILWLTNRLPHSSTHTFITLKV